jgi:hypothetical protein
VNAVAVALVEPLAAVMAVSLGFRAGFAVIRHTISR